MENQVKYVDLQGLQTFARELKTWLKSHVVETDIYTELLHRIENLELYKIVDVLPEIGDENTIYLLKNQNAKEKNLFIEYLYSSEYGWEEVGKFIPDIKLEEYLKIEDSPFEKGEAENSAVLKGEYEGYSNKAISQTSMAVGAATTAGLKGWYYSAIDFSNKTITLSDKPTYILVGNTLLNGGWSSDAPNIKEDDVISLVNNSKYDFCSKVIDVNDNVITVDKLPFENLVQDNGVAAAVLAGQFSDGYSIYIPERPDAGIIDFGGGAFAEGGQSVASNICAHAEGLQTHAYGQYAHAEGKETEAAYAAHAEGVGTKATGNDAHAEGHITTAQGHHAHAEGRETVAEGYAAHAEGLYSVAGLGTRPTASTIVDAGRYAHAEGNGTQASGNSAHSEGKHTLASGNFSHSEGFNTEATAQCAHAEGTGTKATTIASHSEGSGTTASGSASHAEGINTVADGIASHSDGFGTETYNEGEHACGRYNKSTKSGDKAQATQFSIGNGTGAGTRSNSVEVKANGDVYIVGLGGYDGTNPSESNDLVTAIHEKAFSTGNYPNMSVGHATLADDLGDLPFEQEVDFNYRQTANGEAVKEETARIEAVKGNSLVWNQRVKNSNFKEDVSSWSGMYATLSHIQGGGALLTATSTSSRAMTHSFSKKILANHVVFMSCTQKRSSDYSSPLLFLLQDISGSTQYDRFTTSYISSSMLRTDAMIGTTTKDIGRVLVYPQQNGEVGDYTEVYSILVIDLTQMFGAGNEPTTIEEFYARIPQNIDLYAYNEGEVIHSNVDAIESVGFNLWDEQWENGYYSPTDGTPFGSPSYIRSKNFIPIVGGKTYYIGGNYSDKVMLCYDKDYKLIATSRTAPINAAYAKFYLMSSTYNHDICINISDSAKNGTYEPYISREQRLDIIKKYFPNGMRSAGTASDEIRWNKQTQKWEKVVRIAEVDLGSLRWTTSSNNILYAAIVNVGLLYGHNILTIPYVATGSHEVPSVDKTIAITNSATYPIIRIKETAYTDAATFKAAMQGVMLYYELAEPIVTEITEDINLDYEVWNGGTEKAIATEPTTNLLATIQYNLYANKTIIDNKFRLNKLDSKITDIEKSIPNMDPVIWKYLCNPIMIHDGYTIPEEVASEILTSDGKFKYKVPGMYRIHSQEFSEFHEKVGIYYQFTPTYVEDDLMRYVLTGVNDCLKAVLKNGVWSVYVVI